LLQVCERGAGEGVQGEVRVERGLVTGGLVSMQE